MRFELKLLTDTLEVPTDYRPGLLSFIKSAISAYDKQYYAELFKNDDATQKKYCFSPYLPIEKIDQHHIVLRKSNIYITVSTGDPSTGMRVYNALGKMKNKQHKFFEGNLTLEKIALLPDRQINTDKVLVKILSPILTRQHDRDTNTDKYLLIDGSIEAIERIKDNLRYQLQVLAPSLATYVDNFVIEPVNTKKVVVHHYGLLRDATAGTLTLLGHPLLLQHIYDYGLGSHRSAGYGLIDVLQEVV